METASATRWLVPEWRPCCPAPDPAALTIYRVAVADFAGQKAALRLLLTPEEQTRAVRYLRAPDRARFEVGRGCLRYLLGQRLGQLPEQVPLVLNAFGKPELPAAGVHFNVAHSGEWVVIAVGSRQVGIDVEQLTIDFHFADVAAHRYSAAEQHALAHSPWPRADFYALWTRHEARAKATGRGLSGAVERNAAAWVVRSFEVAPGYPGAVAYSVDWEPTVDLLTFDATLIGRGLARRQMPGLARSF